MQANVSKSVTGLFVVGAVALLVVAVLVFGRSRWGAETTVFVLFFEGSVKGLNTGAPVVMKGVRLGSVTDVSLRLNWDNLDFQTKVLIEISEGPSITEIGETFTQGDKAALLKSLVDRGLRAQLELQSIVTGQQMISLDFHPSEGPPRLVGAAPEYLELPTITSGLAKMTKSLEQMPLDEIATNLNRAVQGVEELVNSEQTKDTLASVNKTMKELAGISEKLNARSGPVLEDLDELLRDARKLVNNVDGEIEPLATAARDAFGDARKLINKVDGEFEPLAKDFRGVARAATDSLKMAERLLDGFQGLRSQNSAIAHEIATTLRAISSGL